jgi:hypothetical protein
MSEQSNHTHNGFTFTVSEMSRKAQLDCALEFRAWLEGAGDLSELERVAAISTMITLRTRLMVTDPDGMSLSGGKHDLGDDVVLTLPLTRECLDNDLPASLTGWLINAAAERNIYTLQGFLDGMNRITTMLSESA